MPKKEKRYSKFITYALLVLSIFFLYSTLGSIMRVKKAKDQILDSYDQIVGLKKEKEDLQERLEEIRSEEFVEKQLRDGLGLAKEGDLVIILPEDEKLRQLVPKMDFRKESLPDPNWKKWLKLFL